MPSLGAGEPALTAAALVLLRVDMEKQRNKEILQLKLSMPKFYATLWESLFIESEKEVSQHAQYIQAALDQDPKVLWIIISETHLTAIHAVGLGALQVVQLKNKLSQLRQKPDVSIGEFKKEFDLQLDALLGAAVSATAQPELAMLFISKVDPQRYAGMLNSRYKRCHTWNSLSVDFACGLVSCFRLEDCKCKDFRRCRHAICIHACWRHGWSAQESKLGTKIQTSWSWTRTPL